MGFCDANAAQTLARPAWPYLAKCPMTLSSEVLFRRPPTKTVVTWLGAEHVKTQQVGPIQDIHGMESLFPQPFGGARDSLQT